MTTTVEWEGLGAWISMVEDMRETTPEKVHETMDEIGDDTKIVMDAHTPVRTGKLKEGNTLTKEEDGFTLSNAVDYAKWVNGGTRKMRAQPFLDPAVEYGSQEMDERLPKALDA